MRRAIIVVLSALCCACAPRTREPPPIDPAAPPPEVVASVGVTAPTAAVVWVAARPYDFVAVSARSAQGDTVRGFGRTGGLGTARIAIDGLRPGRAYTVIARSHGRSGTARFVTPPPADARSPLRFLLGGDLGGQNICRDAQLGYPVFSAMSRYDADFFLALGDMIYADQACEPTGALGNAQIPGPPPARGGPRSFAEHWRYNLGAPGLRELRARMGYIATWDDHEVINDFGPRTAHPPDAPGQDLLAAGHRAFVEFNPVLPPPHAPQRLYRSLRWGQHAELFVLDTRQYRDDNLAADSGPAPKTLLGASQREWLLDGLRRSDATWKFVVSSVPVAIPTGWPAENGRDGWASGGGAGGFERELAAVFANLADAGVTGLVWLAADVHYATGLRLRPLDAHPDFVVHELIVGALSAGIFPDDTLDETFRPQRLFLYSPPAPPRSLDEALQWLNFGVMEIDAAGGLSFSIVNARGEVVERLRLAPQRERAGGAARLPSPAK